MTEQTEHSFESLRLVYERPGVATVTLSRPEVRNAFDATLIDELARAFETLRIDADLRLVILRGEGPCFCAGADLNWMRASCELDFEANCRDATQMALMFESIATCPVPVVAMVHGHALGGGAGLVAAADFALINKEAKIGFTEVRLGIIPAVISPFVIDKIGSAHARRYFTSGEIFTGAEAERIGLAQKATALDELEAELEKYYEAVLNAGPQAVREAKKLAIRLSGFEPQVDRELTVPWIAGLRQSAEGQVGMAAFLSKQPAPWAPTKEQK